MANKIVKEAPIDYGNYPERMDPKLERKFGSPENIYAKNPAFKKGAQDVERLAGKRFKEVVDRVRSAFGQEDISSRQVQSQIMQSMMALVPQITQIESRYKTKLKRLAIKLALDETGTNKDWYKIEAYLNEQPIDISNFRMSAEEKKEKKEKPQIPSFDVDVPTDEERMELEIHKRNLINAMIQGEAKKGHYSFLRPDVLDYIESNINPTLATLYRQVMAANDLLYFTMEDMIEMMSRTGNGVAGKVELQNNDDDDEDEDEDMEMEDRPDTKIVANGLIFPILVHELIKGFEEAPAREQFRDMDVEMSREIMGQTDTLVNEPMQLRIGPPVVEAIKFALPDDMFEPENRALHPWFKQILYGLPAKEFLELIGMAISDDDSLNRKARTKFEEIMRDAMAKKKEYEDYGKEEEDYEEDDEDNLSY